MDILKLFCVRFFFFFLIFTLPPSSLAPFVFSWPLHSVDNDFIVTWLYGNICRKNTYKRGYEKQTWYSGLILLRPLCYGKSENRVINCLSSTVFVIKRGVRKGTESFCRQWRFMGIIRWVKNSYRYLPAQAAMDVASFYLQRMFSVSTDKTSTWWHWPIDMTL